MRSSARLKQSMTRKRNVNPEFDDVQILSPKQVLLSYYIIQYRKRFNLSQREMAEICSSYGKANNVKFAQREIGLYESYRTIPTPPKFQVLMNTLNIKSL